MATASPLVLVYIDALCGRAIYVHADGLISHIGLEPLLAQQPAAIFWFDRPAHAELVASRVRENLGVLGERGPDGRIMSPTLLVIAAVKDVAAELGARWQTQAEIERDAETAVAEVVASVAAARQNGGLQQMNYEYKAYRLTQIEKREPAIPYSAYFEHFTRLLVVRAAEKSMMQSG